jgi:type II secretory pathway pseudopilin PulG
MNAGSQTPIRSRQRGMTLFGLMFWAIVIGFLAYVLVRVLPTLNEYATIRRAVEKIAATQPATVAEARSAFDKQRDLEYSISSVTGKDLSITKENDKVVIGFAYNKEIPIYGPVFILIKYEGSSR